MEVDFHHRQYHNRNGADVTVRSLWKVARIEIFIEIRDISNIMKYTRNI